VVIEAMITSFAVQDITRIGLVRQSLYQGIGGHPLGSNRGPGQAAMPLSLEPSQTVRDHVIRVLFTLEVSSTNLGSGIALLKGVKNTHPGVVLGTGKLHRYQDIPSDQEGV
jgi:hypothetical protein